MSDDAGTVYNPFLYDGTTHELERLLLIGICVAGKVARQQQEKFYRFERNLWRATPGAKTIFESIRYIDAYGSKLRALLEEVKMGQYARIVPAFVGIAKARLDLRTCTRDQLCAIHGIGMKTASFFILFTRRNSDVACLDTHVLAWMRERPDMAEGVPRTTPGSKALYLKLEQRFLKYCRKVNRPPGEVDFEIWLARNRGDKNIQK